MYPLSVIIAAPRKAATLHNYSCRQNINLFSLKELLLSKVYIGVLPEQIQLKNKVAKS